MDAGVKVGVGVFVKKGDDFLLGLRIGSHGAGTWALPGGHIEFGESIEDCAIREVLEETGMTINNVQPLTFTSDLFVDVNKHYITLFVSSDWVSGEPMLREPEKCQSWQWHRWHELPEPLFPPLQQLVDQSFLL